MVIILFRLPFASYKDYTKDLQLRWIGGEKEPSVTNTLIKQITTNNSTLCLNEATTKIMTR